MENKTKGWTWIPTLYFAQGLPYVIAMTVAVIMFKRLGLSNSALAFYTGWLYLPWVIKPLWSPLVELLKTKRWWIVTMQIIVGASLAGIACIIPLPGSFRLTLACMWLLAFSSATHDIAADGFYMLALNEKQQAYFVGIRNTFYRIAVITGQGVLVMIAGLLEKHFSLSAPEAEAIPHAWSITFFILAGIFALLFIYHHFILPRPKADTQTATESSPTAFIDTFIDFFHKPGIVAALAFILLFRFAESQLVKIASPFLLDTTASGGLALATSEVGFIYGTIGVISLTLGGIAGGIIMARYGFQRSIWGMTLAMNIPNIIYLYLAATTPTSQIIISTCVAIEQLGYGIGFTALTYYMMLFSTGRHQTAHYALCTGFMALGMMLPGMLSGWIQEMMGYCNFFIWIMFCTIPSFIAAYYIKSKPLQQKQ